MRMIYDSASATAPWARQIWGSVGGSAYRGYANQEFANGQVGDVLQRHVAVPAVRENDRR